MFILFIFILHTDDIVTSQHAYLSKRVMQSDVYLCNGNYYIVSFVRYLHPYEPASFPLSLPGSHNPNSHMFWWASYQLQRLDIFLIFNVLVFCFGQVLLDSHKHDDHEDAITGEIVLKWPPRKVC